MAKMKTLSIGTFNLLNLNEPHLPIYRDKDGWSPDQYQAKIDWTQRIIKLLKPDIFGFQELWHRASMVRALEAAGLTAEYDLLVPDDADGTHIVCAAIVRKGLVVGTPDWITSFPEQFVLSSSGDDPQTPAISVTVKSFSRPVLHFQIRPRDDQPPAHVYVCHFKSKAPTEVHREAWFKKDKPTYSKHGRSIGSAVSTIRRTSLLAHRADEGHAHPCDRSWRHQRRPAQQHREHFDRTAALPRR
jgi:hypothetical protein